MPIEPAIHELHDAKKITIGSVHAAHLIIKHGLSMRARIEFLSQMVQLSQRLGARLLVVHPSHLFTSFKA